MIAAKERRPAGRTGINGSPYAAAGARCPIESVMGTKSSRSKGQVETERAVGVDPEAPAKRVIAASHRPALHVAVEFPVPPSREIRFLNGTSRFDRRQRNLVWQKVPPHADCPMPQPQWL